jgi:energy-coupling factor transporter transmembrane protein EcfT
MDRNKKKIKLISVIEIIILIIIIYSVIELNKPCDFLCFDGLLYVPVLCITIPLFIINVFVIQSLRKKSLFVPTFCLIIIILGIFIYTIVENELSYRPANNINEIISDNKDDYDEDEDNSNQNDKIEYFIHNDKLYYYQYKESYYNGEKGILFKAELDGTNSKKVCELDLGSNFEYNFIYNNEVFYTTRIYDEEKHSNVNSLKRLNLNNCQDETITIEDSEAQGEWEYLLESKTEDKVVINDYYIGKRSTRLYNFDIKYNLINSTNVVTNKFNNYYIDYKNLDIYYIKNSDNKLASIYKNDDLILKLNYKEELKIFCYKNNYLYLYDEDNIYKINLEKKELEETILNNYDSITKVDSLFDDLFYIDGDLYRFNTDTNKFEIFSYKVTDDVRISILYKINNYYVFIPSNIDLNNNYDSSRKKYKYYLYIYDEEGNLIYKKTNLYDVKIDNDNIYTIDSKRKIELVNIQ